MLRSTSELRSYTLLATDGEVGRCKDFLFDDVFWTIRYMVADTAKWLPSRKVLISPVSLGPPDWGSGRIPVRLTKEQIKSAPELDEHAPVSRQYERKYFTHYGWPFYWSGAGAWGMFPHAEPLFVPEAAQTPQEEDTTNDDDKHLRSFEEVRHYKVGNSAEDDLGKVDDFIVEDGTWTVRYLVVDVGGWLRGRKVLLSPSWIENIGWTEGSVTVDMTRETLKAGPPYDPSMPVNRKYEEQLFDFHGRPCYWGEEAATYTASR